ncbi:DUF2239 family protein [Pedomonas mirosovicensis]|uniref:DUF2239 family protein n=1 Tax=Pedomonas mirosovicensis TaxID=2908641 RepID=UPI00216A6443|nr:DUF2239 family protein [Pedomonas mirosovicensis]MCH8685047.1 DUF2239 family protein [Pedomonas mirosovicensis]
MIDALAASYTAFEGHRRLATGSLFEAARAAKQALARDEHAPILIFHNATSRQAEVDFRGTEEDVLARLPAEEPVPARDTAAPAPDAPRGPGRPKLGVVAREVTLLPRQWEWLNSQPGGASVALRKLVDEARRRHEATDRRRALQEAVDRFLLAMAGNLPHYEEATRAFYAKDQLRFEAATADWPADIRAHVLWLIEASEADYWVQ